MSHLHPQMSDRAPTGAGHLYQGRYKSFLVQADDHLLAVCRYVERNPLRARLMRRAEAWRWGSFSRRERGQGLALLADWPLARPDDWSDTVNQPETSAKLEALRAAAQRGRPYGGGAWLEDAVRRFDLGSTLRPRGRPARIASSFYWAVKQLAKRMAKEDCQGTTRANN